MDMLVRCGETQGAAERFLEAADLDRDGAIDIVEFLGMAAAQLERDAGKTVQLVGASSSSNELQFALRQLLHLPLDGQERYAGRSVSTHDTRTLLRDQSTTITIPNSTCFLSRPAGGSEDEFAQRFITEPIAQGSASGELSTRQHAAAAAAQLPASAYSLMSALSLCL